MRQGRRGFTLIELLIVVAIIAILAAIAVPNFLEAQVRAKCSRCVADMRSIATAVEAYYTDCNDYPRNFMDRNWTVSPDLTTPVAFLTAVTLVDPFAIYKESDPTIGSAYFSYHHVLPTPSMSLPPNNWPPPESTDGSLPSGNPGALRKYGLWRLMSLGPDCVYLPPNWQGLQRQVLFQLIETQYDPTNGTISYGNIARTQISSDGKVPAITP